MPRKPIEVEVELAGGRSPRQRMWELIRATAGREFEQMEVTTAEITNDSACSFLLGLTNAGFIAVTRKAGPQTRQRWKLIRDAGIEAPRVRRDGKIVTQGRGNEAIWSAMQALGSFTPRLVAEMAGVSETTVKCYITALNKAGYLTELRAGKTVGKVGIQAEYRLVRSKVHGPRPPMITRLKAVYDPNIHQIVWHDDEDEVIRRADK